MFEWYLHLFSVVGMLSFCLISSLLFMAALLIKQKKERLLWMNKISDIETQCTTIASGSIGVGRKLLSLEKRLLIERKTKIHGETPETTAKSNIGSGNEYRQASILLEQGVTSDKVAMACGISCAEVDLLKILKHKDQSFE